MVERTQPKVEVPSKGEDTPKLGRVGIIAGVGFVIGIAWPHLADVPLAPPAPREPRSGAASSSVESEPAKAKRAAASKAPAERLKIEEVQITSCRDAEGQSQRKCDDIDLDSTVRPHIEKIVQCDAAKGAMGTLSLGVDLDFTKGQAHNLRSGQSTTLPQATTEALLACAEKDLAQVSLKDIQHEHSDYTAFYVLELLPPEAGGEGDGIVPASGSAVVNWRVALIRDEPKEGKILARVLSGTRVIVTGRRDDWYRVKYDAKGNEGWVYKSAIGL